MGRGGKGEKGGEMERKGKESERGKGRKGEGRKGEGTKGRRRGKEGKEIKGMREGKGVILCSCDFSFPCNGDGGCGRQLPIFGGLTAQVDWLGLRVGGHPALSLHSSDEPGELSQ